MGPSPREGRHRNAFTLPCSILKELILKGNLDKI